MKKALQTILGTGAVCMALMLPVFPGRAAEQVEGYTQDGQVLTVKVTNGGDITSNLKSATEKAKALGEADGKIYTVKIPAGSYFISDITHIYSNTTLSMYDVTLTTKKGIAGSASFNMLTTGSTTYNNSKECKGYEGFKNITLEGGTWVGASNNEKTQIRMFHATNVTVKDITIQGGNNNHMLEVAAIDNFNVTGCTFKDMAKSSKSTKREALQLDLAANDEIYPDIVQDGTMMKNVTIDGNTFTNVCRGIGSHSILQGAYMENIKITNNTFTNLEAEAITALNYYQAHISKNTITDCGTGILFQYSKGDAKTIFTTINNGKTVYNGSFKVSAASRISENVIVTKYNKLCDENQGIKLYGRNITKDEKNSVDGGTVKKGNYYVSNVTVENNDITTSGYGISLNDAKKCTINGNKIKGSGYDSSDPIAKKKSYNGIHLGQASAKNVISNNTIENVQQNGIFFQEKSTATSVTGNTITKPGKNGIHLYQTAGVSGAISGNTITNVKDISISIDQKSTVGSIEKNVIKGAKSAGIYVLNQAVIKKNISGNKVSSTKLNGININNSAKVKGGITGNTVSSVAKTAIYVLNKASVGKGISKNKVSGAKEHGIAVNNKGTVKGGIKKNTVSKAKKMDIYVLNGAKVTGKISGNTVEKGAKKVVVAKNAKGKIGKNKKK